MGVTGRLIAPERLSLAESPLLRPMGLLPKIGVAPPLLIPGYDGLVRQLQNGFRGRTSETPRIDVARPESDPDLSADIVLFPYDFRLGVRDAAERLKSEIDRRLSSLTSGARQRRVIVVAHSMGGLVARYWLGPLEGAPDCHALITAGTPHRGAPKVLDWLVNGVRFGPVPLRRATAMLADWTSAYDLLPRYQAVWSVAQGEALYPHELDEAAFASRDQHTGFVAKAKSAYEMHCDIEQGWEALGGNSPEVVPLFSRGHGTLCRAELGDFGLKVTKSGAEWLPNPEWGGDGTVPALSATPLELSDRQGTWRPVVERHSPMAGTGSIVKLLREYAADSTVAARGDRPDRPWLGLDLPEFVAAGDALRVEATLLGAAGADAASVTVSSVDDQAAAPVTVGLARAGDARWAGQVPGLSPGLYECVVGVVGVPEVDQVRCADVLAVVEP